MLLFPDPEGLHAAFIEFASPGHDLVGIADLIDRCDLPARKLLTVLMRQHLQLELRTVLAALRTQPVNAVKAVVAYPSTDLLLRH